MLDATRPALRKVAENQVADFQKVENY
jgi:hypothetical protein